MKKIFTAVLALFVLMTMGCRNSTSKENPYDYYADCLTQQQVESLAQEPFVKVIFPFSLMIFQRPGESNPMNGQTAYLAAWSFDNLVTSSFSRNDLAEEDPSILGSPQLNPVIIDSLAKAVGCPSVTGCTSRQIFRRPRWSLQLRLFTAASRSMPSMKRSS